MGDLHSEPEVPADGAEAYYAADRSELVDFLATHRSLTGRALDIGCSGGTLGAQLLARGFVEVVGIEPVERAAETAATRLSRVCVGTFDSIDITVLGLFDLVVFADSLEHMVDPWNALSKAKAALKPDGVMLLSVPNVGHWSVAWPLLRSARWSYSDEGLLDRTHLRFFTPSSLVCDLRSAHLRIVATGGSVVARPPLSTPSGIALRLLARGNPDVDTFQMYVIAQDEERLNG